MAQREYYTHIIIAWKESDTQKCFTASYADAFTKV